MTFSSIFSKAISIAKWFLRYLVDVFKLCLPKFGWFFLSAMCWAAIRYIDAMPESCELVLAFFFLAFATMVADTGERFKRSWTARTIQFLLYCWVSLVALSWAFLPSRDEGTISFDQDVVWITVLCCSMVVLWSVLQLGGLSVREWFAAKFAKAK